MMGSGETGEALRRRVFPQLIEDVEIDRYLLAQLQSQWNDWRSGDGDEQAIPVASAKTAEIRSVADAMAATGRGPELEVPSAKDAERYLAFVKKLGGCRRVEPLWEEEQSAELRQYEWATLRDLALLAGELERREAEASPPAGIAADGDSENDLDPSDEPAALQNDFDASAVASGERVVRPAPRCLEIGGGFGRVTDGMLHLFEGRARSIVVDSNPAALAASYAYLCARWPELNTKICIASLDAWDLEEMDILIVPSWHLGGDVLSGRVDLLADLGGVEALGEAERSAHFAFIDRTTAPGGLLYFMHSRDLVSARDDVYPRTWQLRYKRRTPWSQSPDHPAEIYLKTDRDCLAANRRTELAYLRTVVRQYRIERLAAERTMKVLREKNARFSEWLERARIEGEEARSAMLEFLDWFGDGQNSLAASLDPRARRELERALLRLRLRAR